MFHLFDDALPVLFCHFFYLSKITSCMLCVSLETSWGSGQSVEMNLE